MGSGPDISNNIRLTTLASFNCRSVKRSMPNIRHLCNSADVIALQETWLLPHDIPFLGNIHNDFEYTGKSAVDTSEGILRGRPYGGVAILWRKGLFRSVSVIQCTSNRLCVISASLGERSIIICSVYMPTDSADNLLEFTECMAELSAIVESCDTESVYMLGDFNADPTAPFGSGIYSGKAGALASTMPGVPTTRLLVSRVPKVPGQVTTPGPGPIYDPPSDHDSLVLITDPSLPSHVTRQLAEGPQEFSLTDREVTCHFKINLTERQPGYVYRAAAFSGVRSYTGVATGGTRICSIFACIGNNITDCGKRFPQYSDNTTAIFNELSITATVPTPVIEPLVEARNSGYFPVSLNTNIMPLEPKDYTYSEDARGNVTVYTLVLNTKEVDLYTFAVWGRYFATDGLVEDPPREDHDTEENEPDSGNVHQLSGLLIAAVILLFYANL